jgi:AraC-like DNA-binding protein
VPSGNWIKHQHDADTGIDSLHAHFRGHAYDPHDHDEVLVGVTQQGVQQFRCRRRHNTSTPGRAILIEPGEVHDGTAPEACGFTYAMLYLPQAWLAQQMAALAHATRPVGTVGFSATLSDDPGLASAIAQTFSALHGREGRLARDLSVNRLLTCLAGHTAPDPHVAPDRRLQPALPPEAARVRDVLHAAFAENIGLDTLAQLAGIDRFRLNRQFRQSFGLSPHAYLVQLRLKAARRRLAQGEDPVTAAMAVGFADQSHMGRWFRRAYGLTPAAYRRACTNVPD